MRDGLIYPAQAAEPDKWDLMTADGDLALG